jgi:phosphoglycerate dehydrogenase-like enzyme
MHIHFEQPLEPSDIGIIESRLVSDHRLSSGTMDPTELSGEKIDYLVAGRPSAELLDTHPEIKALIIPWVGPPKATIELIRRRPSIAMYNIHHNAVPVAELALGLLFSAARNIPLRDNLLRRGNWDGSYHLPTMLLRGKTVLLLGYGAISRELHPVLQALGMKVIAIRRDEPHMDFVYQRDDLPKLLPDCDVLINTLPHTPETEGMIGEMEFKSMKRGSIVVNVGRGRVFEEHALFRALADGIIQAAGIDVWYKYPRGEARSGETLPSEEPFWELENIVLSPHIGGEWPNPEVQRMRMEHIADLLESLLTGRGPAPLDPVRGY